MDADRSSFEAYVQSRTAALSRIAFLLTGDHHLAEDLVQQTYLRVAGRWRKVVAAGDPDPYVRKVLYHQHVSWWRRSRRTTETALGTTDQPVPDTADQVAITIAVQQALAQLGPRQRAALILRYLEDFTEVQTAEILGCRVGTVKSHARRQGKSGTPVNDLLRWIRREIRILGLAPRRGSERYGWPG